MGYVLLVPILVGIFLRFRDISKKLSECEKKLDLLEAVVKLPAPEKSKIVSHVDRVAPGNPGPNDESTPDELVRRWGEEKDLFNEVAASPNSDNPSKHGITQQNLIVDESPALLPREELCPAQENSPKLPEIGAFIADNWIPILGSVACVIGTVFFGITSGLFYYPETRLATMISFAILAIIISSKLKDPWMTVRSLFRSLGGATILVAAVGAGGIEGLKCIDSPIGALAALCIGISVNIYLGAISPIQVIASGHVLLSLIAFWFAPQNLLFLPLAAIVAIVGMLSSYRSKWDLHLFLIIIGFFIQNIVWTLSLKLTPSMDYLAMACSLAVGLVAASVHYSKKYQSIQRQRLPLIVHILNWILLAFNISMHSQFSHWAFFILSLAAAAGFFLSRIAKKKEILWLYYTDTCLSQFTALAAVVALSRFSIQSLDICIFALVELTVFNLIHNLLKEKVFVRVGYAMQTIVSLIFTQLIFEKLSLNFSEPNFSLYWRIGIVIAMNCSFYIYGKAKNFISDTASYLIFKSEELKNQPSIAIVFSSIFFLITYVFASQTFLIQCAAAATFLTLGFWRAKKQDPSWDLSFLMILGLSHLHTWKVLASEPTLGFRIDFLALVAVDILLISKNKLQLTNWKTDIYNLVIYALAIQIGLMSHVYYKIASLYISGLAFLGYSLIALETARYLSSKLKFDGYIRAKIQTSLLHAGMGFLICFFYSFITIYLQLEADWKGVSLRIISEILACSTLGYWIIYAPKTFPQTKANISLSGTFIEMLLGFLSLTVFTESADLLRPSIWAIIALSLIIGSKYFHWPVRLYSYSWFYLIASIVHIAFITGYLTSPTETYFLPAFGAICLQFIYAFIAHKKDSDRLDSIKPFRQYPTIGVLLPIFIGIALFFSFNYEKTLLTLFWVGLSSLYLSLSLWSKSKWGITIAMIALAICNIRLISFDLVQSNTATRALVFFGVGILMMMIGMLYKKYKYRIEIS